MRLTHDLELRHDWTVQSTDADDWAIRKDGELLGVVVKFADAEPVILAHETGDAAWLDRNGWARS